jgi:hypothetical protein
VSFLGKLFGKKEEPAPQKPDRFRGDAEAFATRCAAWREIFTEAGKAGKACGAAPSTKSIPSTASTVAVVVSPWISTPVPFFSLECALALKRAGVTPTLLWDTTEIVGNVPNKKHRDIIAAVFPALPPDIPLLDVSHATIRPGEHDAGTARRIVYENAVRNVRGEMNIQQFFAAHPEAEADTQAHIARIRATLAAGRFDWLLTPGGIFGVSAIYVAVARELGIPFSTFDSGPGRLRLVHDGIAAHLADLPRAFEIVNRELTAAQKERAMQLGREELTKRAQGKDDRGFQVVALTEVEEKCDVLIPLNIRWDSAALSRQRLFASVEENIAAVLDWAASKPGLTVCIRQHPNERREHLRGSDNWEGLLARFGRMGERVRWIAAADPVNTYDLIRKAKVVLPHTSTVGIEAALLGRPVVLSTQVYYDGFPFVWNPATRNDFFALLEEAVAGGLAPGEEAREQAALAYFMTQQCAVMRTPFTPQNEDYAQWVRTPPEALWAGAEPWDFLKALCSREPLAAIRARRLLAP